MREFIIIMMKNTDKLMKNMLYILVLLLIPGYGFAEETLQEKVEKILNKKTIDDPYKRWAMANDTIDNYLYQLPFEEAMLLYNDILLPFVEKKVKEDRKRNKAKFYIYNSIGVIYGIRKEFGDNVTEEAYRTKAMEFAELSGDPVTQALAYRIYGSMKTLRGNISLGHEYLYKAIHLYESLNNYEGIFTGLSTIAECLTQTRDSAGMRKIIEQMQQCMEKPSFDRNYKRLFDLYSVQYVYYDLLAKENSNTAYNDTAFVIAGNIINLIENNRGKIAASKIVVAYYNMALSYGKCYPERNDSIYHYLDKALKLKTGYQHIDIQMEIGIYEFYAELHFEHKRYDQAEKDMLYVLSLLKQEDYFTIIPHYTEAYKFLSMYYETMNRPHEALKYHKLLLENEEKRYANDKITVMDDMLVKYETEKKIEHIDRLTEQNKTARKIVILTISLVILLLIGLLIFIRSYKILNSLFTNRRCLQS